MALHFGTKTLGVDTRGARRIVSAPQQRPARAPRSAVTRATPPDVPQEEHSKGKGRAWLETILSRFGPVRAKASSPTTLDFEKPLLELDKRIKEVRSAVEAAISVSYYDLFCVGITNGELPLPQTQVRKVAEENGVDVSQSIAELETRARQVQNGQYVSRNQVVACTRLKDAAWGSMQTHQHQASAPLMSRCSR